EPEVHSRANRHGNGHQDQRGKNAICKSRETERRGAMLAGWSGRINNADASRFSWRSASPTRSDLRFWFVVPLCELVRHIELQLSEAKKGMLLVQPERHFDRHNRRDWLPARSDGRLELPALHGLDRFLFQPETRALHH